jgi:hypothetical protein
MRNIGFVDRIVRLFLGVALLVLFFVLPGDLRYLGLIGLVPLLTAAIGVCPAYWPLKINTRGTKPPATDGLGGSPA